jgi:hypothetical protein
MKNLIGLLLFFIAGTGLAAEAHFTSNECAPEAQFIGTVKNFSAVQKSESLVECTYQIEFSLFNPNQLCPLLLEETTEHQFIDSDCSHQNGEMLSGVLSKRGSFIVVE